LELQPRKHRIVFSQTLREDLRTRLASTRWSDFVTSDWQYGMKNSVIRGLTNFWLETYDFDEAEERLNTMPRACMTIEGFDMSYIHIKGSGVQNTPLLLMNGWPSSFVEYTRLANRLANPRAYGDASAESFDVVIPAMPGFGYSERPTRPNQFNTEELFNKLMTEGLGYSCYWASGTDIGAGVATRLALRYPTSVKGIHISSVVNPALSVDSRTLTEAERAYRDASAQWALQEGAYEHVHYTRPQTLAFALADSPAGLASWIVDKFHSWTDHEDDLLDVFPPETLIDNLMVYWSTETIGSSMRYYYESAQYRAPFTLEDRVTVPTAVCMWPKDLTTAPREWAERFYNVRQYTLHPHGGHFPAWEEPEAYAADLRSFTQRTN
jgi:pimeloyl-ACP methyl ester carboxylesterase